MERDNQNLQAALAIAAAKKRRDSIAPDKNPTVERVSTPEGPRLRPVSTYMGKKRLSPRRPRRKSTTSSLISLFPTITENELKEDQPSVERRASAPDPITEIQRKLAKEENKLKQLREAIHKTKSKDKNRLKSSIIETVTLIQSLRQNLLLQNEYFISNGFLRLKKGNEGDFVSYWIQYEFPTLICFRTEFDTEPIDSISLVSTARIIKKPNTSIFFSIQTTTTLIDFMAETPEECECWIRSFSESTGIRVVERERKTTKLELSQKDFRRVIKKQEQESSHSTKADVQKYKFYEASICKDFKAIASSFSQNIEVEDGELKSGTLEDLISWCIFHSVGTTRNEDASALFLCHHWICSTEIFVETIISIWNRWRKRGMPGGLSKVEMKRRLCIFVYNFIESPVVSKNYEEEAKSRGYLREKIAGKRKSVMEYFLKAKFPREPHVYKPIDSNALIDSCDIIQENVIGFPLEDVANQLTLDECELFRKISILEWMDHNWEIEDTGPSLCEMVKRYNKISRWVAYVILDYGDQKNEQIHVFKKFVKLAQNLHDLRNYNTCTAIIGGLSDASVARLKCIKNNLTDKTKNRLEKLKEIYSPINGYKDYRKLPIYPACIPAVGVYLRDLTLTLDGNPVYNDNMKTLANFERMKIVAKRVLELYHIDTSKFNTELIGNSTVKRHLAHINPPSQDDLYELSLSIEPIRSKKTLEEEFEQLKQENEQLRLQMKKLKVAEKNRIIEKQRILEAIQNSDSKASTTVRALLESITDGATNQNEQIILLKLQLQAALDLCIDLENDPVLSPKFKKK